MQNVQKAYPDVHLPLKYCNRVDRSQLLPVSVEVTGVFHLAVVDVLHLQVFFLHRTPACRCSALNLVNPRDQIIEGKTKGPDLQDNGLTFYHINWLM